MVSQADKDRRRLLAEIDDLKELANTLKMPTELYGSQVPGAAQPDAIGKTVDQLHTILRALESKVPGESQSLLQKFKWEYTKADINEIIEYIERVKSLINIQLSQANLCAHRHS